MSNQRKTLEINNLTKVYNKDKPNSVSAIQDISISIYKGEILCILGKSGCGKSTFLNIIAGLIPPTKGSISIFDKIPQEAQTDITYIQQTPYVLPYRTVFENAVLGLELRKELSNKTLSKLSELLEFLGFKDFYSHYPSELSGGMRQRLAFARTLSIKASIVLCDEPLSSLDFDTRLEIENFFWEKIKTENRTSIFVTHQIDSAVSLADRIVIFSPRPASIMNIIELNNEFRKLSPAKRRESKEFSEYHTAVWRSLQSSIKGNND